MAQQEAFSQYYVRHRGRVVGPMSLEKVRQLAQRGHVGRLHEVSADGLAWIAASSRFEIFEGAERAAESKNAAAAATTAAPAPVSHDWFFLQGGDKQGPFPRETLEAMLQEGRLSADTLIWTNGMTDWKLASDVPLFAKMFRYTSSATQDVDERSERPERRTAARTSRKSKVSVALDDNLFHRLVNSRQWVLFIAIFLDLMFAISVIFVFLSLVGGLASSVLAGPVLSGALMATPGLLVLLVAAVLLHLYHVALVQFNLERDAASLKLAFGRLFSLWVFMSANLLLSLLCIAVVVLVALVAGY